jgi:ribosome-binding protein aMBF1 (putative translation factor)
MFYPFPSRRHMDVVKREADRAVKEARTTGSLVQQPCEVCGRKKSEAHHDDYAKPLDVKWLCRFHHRQRDVELRELENKPPVKRDEAKFAALVARNTPRHLLARHYSLDLIRQATAVVAAAMDAECISENVLSKRLGVSRQLVNTNFGAGLRTLKTLAAYADALGYEASIVLRKRKSVEDTVAS